MNISKKYLNGVKNERRGIVMFKRISATYSKRKEIGRRQKYKGSIFVVGIAGVVFILYIKTCNIKSTQWKQVSFIQQKMQEIQEESETSCYKLKWKVQESTIDPLEVVEQEEWYNTDRKLTDSEWEAMTQMILSEARGESFEVQYYIACVVLNRVDSEYFPDTIEGVIYQTDPVQFQGAWDPNWYEPSGSVLEAIQTALEENKTPDDMYYFTSEGWLPKTKAWKQVGGMWFSCQE